VVLQIHIHISCRGAGQEEIALSEAPSISFADPEVLACPYSAYAVLREEAPVYLDPGTGTYVITRYEDVRRILLDPASFGSAGYLDQVTDTMLAERAERVRALYRDNGWLPGPALGFIDDPRHADVRAIFEKAFRASRIKELDPRIRDTAFRLVRRTAEKGSCDFVDEVAIPLPLHVTGLITGVPEQDLPNIRLWTDAFIRRFGLMISEEEERECVLLEIEAQHYLKGIIDRLRAQPDDTLLSDIVNTPMRDGTLLTDNELLAHLMADTFVGGSETTTSALSAGMRMLGEDAELRARLTADPERHLRAFIEEVLRLESPVQGLYRVAARPVELHGVLVPQGAVLNLRYASANRDRQQFAEPDRVNVDRRAPGSHLAFGSGIHHCVGATLARRELYWGFMAVIQCLDHIELDPSNDFAYAPSLMLRRLQSLRINYSPREQRG
jgi:cytochrome P450